MFFKKTDLFMGEYKSFFDWNVFSRIYYVIPIFEQFCIGIILVIGSVSFAAGILSVLVLLSSIVIVIVKKPFADKANNVRSILHKTLSILILTMYTVLSIHGPSRGQGILTYIPYVIVILLILNMILGSLFILRQFFMNKKSVKNQSKSNSL